MDMEHQWRELYQAALLELRPEELWQRIGEAEEAVLQRIEELRCSDSSFEAESQALADAQRMLRFMANTECKSSRLTVSGSGRDEVAL
jgi:hypothetical protein